MPGASREKASPALPSEELLREQADWLAPARARLLRRADNAHRRRVLDLGAGYGAVTGELVRRSSGGRRDALVLALDISLQSLCEGNGFGDAARLNADSAWLPIHSGSIDLVFCQCSLLWMAPLERCLDEIRRILQPGGALLAIEPDYGGLIEYPAESAARDLWLAALRRSGAEPHVGRRLPGLLEARGFEVKVDLLDRLEAANCARFDFLRGLPLTTEESGKLDEIENQAGSQSGWQQIAHLPFFLITAEISTT